MRLRSMVTAAAAAAAPATAVLTARRIRGGILGGRRSSGKRGKTCYPSAPSEIARKRGSLTAVPRRLAQSVEHHLHTVGVIGSSPIAPTNATHSRRTD